MGRTWSANGVKNFGKEERPSKKKKRRERKREKKIKQGESILSFCQSNVRTSMKISLLVTQ